MTRVAEKIIPENKIVVTFDICSSSNIIEDLSLTGNLQAMRNMLIGIKNFLRKNTIKYNFDVYKFTGDGWILLFPENTTGKDLLSFLRQLSLFFIDKIKKIESLLETKPQIMGITFGVDGGQLIKIIMMSKAEYIGRPLNIACRLQDAIKDRDKYPAYKVLVSNHIFQKLGDCSEYQVLKVKRTLRNIQGGKDYQCVKINLMRKKISRTPVTHNMLKRS